MERKFKFEFTQSELNILTAGLGKLPMETAIAAFQSLQQQFQIQQEQTTIAKSPAPANSPEG